MVLPGDACLWRRLVFVGSQSISLSPGHFILFTSSVTENVILIRVPNSPI
jgi:hypothetical protein